LFNCPFEGRSAATPTICNPEAIQRFLNRALGVIAGLGVLVFLSDTAYVHLTPHPFDSVRIQPLLSFPMKDGKTMFVPGDPQDQQCVRSLFPHFGCQPCWYLNRQKKKPQSI
jgi:hypothetical protein